jgi:8-oxo-dGTP pyrophosphatase MutT (NUDIX family)
MEKMVYKGKIIQVSEETINGVVWERAYLPDGVIIFAFNEDNKILFVKEKRPHENPPYRLKPVTGMMEKDGSSPEDNANRELQEEIGFKASKLECFYTMENTGTINGTQYFFKATGLTPNKIPNPDGEDTIMEIVPLSMDEILRLYTNNEMKWSFSTLGFLKLYLFTSK